mmetsp:Transcript_20684/g.28902  ORF Transcript_20684/g.28902 Transcript_20684/m.28902 type:complete len:329 (-) Transcript_20684:53-1039(-)
MEQATSYVPVKRRGWSAAGFWYYVSRCCLWSCSLTLIFFAGFVSYVAFTPSRWKGGGGIYIMGERRISTDIQATTYASEAMEEVVRVLEDKHEWHTLQKGPGELLIESNHVTEGPYNTSNCWIVRMKMTLNVDPSRLPKTQGSSRSMSRRILDFMMTKEGYQLIDPDSDPSDFNQWVVKYPWKPQSTLGIQHARYPPKHEVVVMNAYDSNRQLFVSKSVEHALLPGASVYSQNFNASAPPSSGRTRGVIQFGLRTREGEKPRQVILEVEYFMDAWMDNGFIGNWVNCGLILQGIAHRMRKRVGTDGCSQGCACGDCKTHCRSPPVIAA